MKTLRFMAMCFCLISGTTAAAIVDLFSTGLGSGPTDPNYTITAAPAGAAVSSGPASIFTNNAGSWVPNVLPAHWIGTTGSSNGDMDQPEGSYGYRTTFSGDGTLAFSWAADNEGEVVLDGTTIISTISDPGFNSLNSVVFDVIGGGPHTLDFNVVNTPIARDNPTGLLVQVVPIPATIYFFVSAVAGLFYVRRKNGAA